MDRVRRCMCVCIIASAQVASRHRGRPQYEWASTPPFEPILPLPASFCDEPLAKWATADGPRSPFQVAGLDGIEPGGRRAASSIFYVGERPARPASTRCARARLGSVDPRLHASSAFAQCPPSAAAAFQDLVTSPHHQMDKSKNKKGWGEEKRSRGGPPAWTCARACAALSNGKNKGQGALGQAKEKRKWIDRIDRIDEARMRKPTQIAAGQGHEARVIRSCKGQGHAVDR